MQCKTNKKTHYDSAFFVKLKAKDQIERLNRTVTKSTIEWWKKQCLNSQVKSVVPHESDVTAEEAIELFRDYAKQFPNYRDVAVWARGNLDQLVLDSLEEKVNAEPVFHYSKWRDVRTAIDFLTGSNSGYCDVNYEGFDPFLHVTKHNPIDDCAYDIMMLLYGVNKE